MVTTVGNPSLKEIMANMPEHIDKLGDGVKGDAQALEDMKASMDSLEAALSAKPLVSAKLAEIINDIPDGYKALAVDYVHDALSGRDSVVGGAAVAKFKASVLHAGHPAGVNALKNGLTAEAGRHGYAMNGIVEKFGQVAPPSNDGAMVKPKAFDPDDPKVQKIIKASQFPEDEPLSAEEVGDALLDAQDRVAVLFDSIGDDGFKEKISSFEDSLSAQVREFERQEIEAEKNGELSDKERFVERLKFGKKLFHQAEGLVDELKSTSAASQALLNHEDIGFAPVDADLSKPTIVKLENKSYVVVQMNDDENPGQVDFGLRSYDDVGEAVDAAYDQATSGGGSQAYDVLGSYYDAFQAHLMAEKGVASGYYDADNTKAKESPGYIPLEEAYPNYDPDSVHEVDLDNMDKLPDEIRAAVERHLGQQSEAVIDGYEPATSYEGNFTTNKF